MKMMLSIVIALAVGWGNIIRDGRMDLYVLKEHKRMVMNLF